MAELSIAPAITLFLAGVLAGVCNAVAGGGTLFTFPAFVAAGVPPVVANASNAVAVWPGHALAVVAYRRELAELIAGIRGTLIVTVCGGLVGALLLTIIDNAAFSRLVPFLILLATALFAFGGPINRWLHRRAWSPTNGRPGLPIRLFECLAGIYGGFFGAGLGVMVMAGLQILGVSDLQTNNALKNLIATAVTSVAVLVLVVSGLVSWPHTLVAVAGALLGGYGGARVARVVPAGYLRVAVITVGLGLTLYYTNAYLLQ